MTLIMITTPNEEALLQSRLSYDTRWSCRALWTHFEQNLPIAPSGNFRGAIGMEGWTNTFSCLLGHTTPAVSERVSDY